MQRCTRAKFAQNLHKMNLLMYAIVLTATLHEPYIFLTAKIPCISIIYLKISIIVIECLLSTGNMKIHLLPNLDFSTYPIITNGER